MYVISTSLTKFGDQVPVAQGSLEFIVLRHWISLLPLLDHSFISRNLKSKECCSFDKV